jgi:hypothetical protein
VRTISPRTFCASSTAAIRAEHCPVFGFAFILWTEFRRAVAAERRYEKLRRNGNLARQRVSRTDIARHIFEEYYSWDISDG